MLGVALDKGIRHTLKTKVKTGAIVSRLSRFLQILFFSDKANIAVNLICLLKQETKKKTRYCQLGFEVQDSYI